MTTPSERTWTSAFAPSVDPVVVADDETALSLFDRTCASTPDGPAIHHLERTYTWAEVDEQSRRLASWMRRRGLQAGDRVAVWMQNVPEFVITQLGTWRAGCTVVPLNPMLRDKEVAHQLRDSGARLLVADDGLVRRISLEALEGDTSLEATIVVGGERTDQAGGRHEPPLFQIAIEEAADDRLEALAPSPGDAALLVYTSGTTGLPKAAVNTHANVVFNARVYQAWMRLDPSDVILGGAPLFHITGLLAGVAASHVAGCPLVLFDRFQPELALEMIERWRTTFTVLPSTAIRALLGSPSLAARDISSLTKLYSGGAPIPAPLVDEWRGATGQAVHSIYGLTETTSPSHAAPLGRPVRTDEESGLLAVGVPVHGVECKVVDEVGREVPDGTLGELWIRGPMVVPGYWQNPEATAASITDGFLHTGDVGKRDSDGWFYVVDRIKDMINASGFKVWPREIEDTLLGHPGVAEAAVVGVPDAYRGETVKAFIRPRDGQHLTGEELIAWAREHMAAYKYPRQVELVDELPKTASGKILRRALRQQRADHGAP